MDEPKEHSPHVKLALLAIEEYVRNRRVIPVPEDTPEELTNERAAVFVSLKKHGQLRGCIGTIEPVRVNLAEEIIYNAISAATADPRFNPVSEDELPDLVCSVDVLFPPEKIHSTSELDIIRYGVIVEKGLQRGLLLPNIEGINSIEQQVAIAAQKAGIYDLDGADLYRFEVKRYY